MIFTNVVSAVLLTLTGIVFIFIFLKHLRISVCSYFWPTTLAEMQIKTFDYDARSKGDSGIPYMEWNWQMIYHANMIYKYCVDGKTYNLEAKISSEDLKVIQKALTENNQAWEKVRLYYNPANPEEILAVTDRSLLRIIFYFVMLVLAGLIFGWGVTFAT